MFKTTLLVLIACLLAISTTFAGDLYRVQVKSSAEVDKLKAIGIEPLVQLTDGYLAYAANDIAAELASAGISYSLVASSVLREQLALDNRLDRANVARFPLLFEEDGIRVYQTIQGVEEDVDGNLPLRSLEDQNIQFVFAESPSTTAEVISRLGILGVPLDTLISKISQDSLQATILQLQSYPPRLAGSTANYNSRDWIVGKLSGYGYDSIVTDSFMAVISSVLRPCQNILAYKIGTTYPNHYVIVGAHRDAVSVSPGADDNGSGTAGVMEIARVLANVPTSATMIFALWDAEESGLYGSYHYVSEATERGDSIVYNLNMDMIAHYENTDSANVFHGPILTYSNLWIHLADSLLAVKGVLAGSSSGSDHYPFTLKGFDASFVAERKFSTVYHQVRDSSTYMSFPYMTKLVKASVATAYSVAETFLPKATLAIQFPSGTPSMLTPNASSQFDVSISSAYGGSLVSGTERLYFGLNGSDYDSVPLTNLGAGQYRATLPAQSCDSRYRYFAGAIEATNGSAVLPRDTSLPNNAVVATLSAVPFDDNFETDKGWVVTGAPADGPWTRGVPAGFGLRADPIYDYDGSGQCWLTDNVIGNSDVDGGTTVLTSPTFDITSGTNALISFAVWYSNAGGGAPYGDVFRVYITNDNGGVWTIAKTIGPVQYATGGWNLHSLWATDFVSPSNQMKIRFEAGDDIANPSLVEAAVDAITVTTYTCVPPTCCIGTTGNVNMAGIVDLSDLSSLVSYLTGGGFVLPCNPEANINNAGIVDLSDLSSLVSYLTGGGYTLPNCQ